MKEEVRIININTDGAVESIKDLQGQVDVLKAKLKELESGTAEYESTVNQLAAAEDKLKTVMGSDTFEKPINSVAALKKHINELKDSLVTMDSTSSEYQSAVEDIITSQTKLNEIMSISRGAVSAQTGSYNALVNQMGALKTAWRATTSEVQRAQLGERIRQVNDQLKSLDASIGNHQRNVGNYEAAIQTLNGQFDSQKQELAALKVALDNLEPGSEAYNQAFTRAAEITHNLQERQEELRMSANDLGTQLSNVANIGAGLVGGFNAVNAIMALTGQKNEDLQRTMVKLQAGIALVQGLKGIEGAVKSFKAYGQWAANAYDRIVELVSGQKKLQTQTQATTVAAEANTAANNANATASKAAAGGAATLGTSMRGAAASTTVATAAATAFKAVIMSLGIGVAVAAITGLITLLGKLASTNSKNLKDSERANEHYMQVRNRRLENEESEFNRLIELMRASGATEEEIFNKTMEYHDKRLQMYDIERRQLGNLEEAARKASNSYWANNSATFKNAATQKNMMEEAGFEGPISFSYIEDQLKELDDVVIDFERRNRRGVKVWSDELVKDFMRVKEEGIKDFKDLEIATKGLQNVILDWKDEYRFDPMSGVTNTFKAQALEINKAAKDALKTELQLEKEHYQEQKSILENNGLDTTALTRAHWTRVTDIVTSATQSIIDSAKAANQTELANLQDAEEKEIKELKKYYADKKKVTITTEEGITKTITAEEAVRAKYAKERRKIELNETIKATERAVAELQGIANGIKNVEDSAQQTYERYQAAGVTGASTILKAQTAAIDEQYEYTTAALTQIVGFWDKIYKQIENDTTVDTNTRLAIWDKYIAAKAALEDAETKHTLDQIKLRREALNAEIKEIQDRTDTDSTERTKNKAINDYNSAEGWAGFWNVVGGFVQNPSFEQQQYVVDIKYSAETESLKQQLEVYKRVIDDMNSTDAERTAAQEKQADIRKQMLKLEADYAVETANVQINKQKELINTIVDVGNSIGQILGSVADAWEDNVDAQVKAGEMSEAQAEKEKEKIRGLQITQAIINTAAGSLGAFTQASQTIPPPYGQIVGAAAAAAVVAQGIAQIAAIRNASENSSVGASTMMAQVTPVFPDYQPMQVGTITGQDERENLANAISDANIYVRVTDIDDAQERGRVRVTEATY